MATRLCPATTNPKKRSRRLRAAARKNPKVVDAAFAVSVPLVATKLFHRLDSMAQQAIHGCDIDTCTARGKVPTSKERGVLIERFLKFAAFSNGSES